MRKFAVVCFYTASKGGNGAAEVSLGIFNAIKSSKKLFEINDQKIQLNFLRFLYKFFYIIKFVYKIKKFFQNVEKKIIVIEGASWVGYSFLFFILCKIFIKKIIVIYHSHNIEYDIRIRKKENKIIILLTKYFEKLIFRLSDFATVVSRLDQNRIKKLYNLKSYILENGINIKRLKKKKPKFSLPKKYYMFIGSYWFLPNKEAIDLLIDKIHPKIKKEFPKYKLVITGEGFPKEKIKKNQIIYFNNINKKSLNYIISKSSFLLFPLKKATGTKLKVIESLALGKQIITNNHGVQGIKLISKEQPLIYKNKKEIINHIKKIENKKKSNTLTKVSNYYKKKYDMSLIFDKFIRSNKI
jgi:hypothetical protein